ncbi:MAG: integral rane sensor signal transduction histidine kinase [Actinomycetia bacterium]|nr:integral rane sensor signal transduction histidine kinase [Actinomycetes bacterium]
MRTRLIQPLLGSAAAVTSATLAVWALTSIAPTLSLGVLYVFAVLPVAVFWGIRWALAVAVASMLSFNFFFLPPVHTFALNDSTNWFALTGYSVTAVVVSELAADARRRALDAEQREREASLLAKIAVQLLGGQGLDGELGWIEERAAEVLGAPNARIEFGPRRSSTGETIPLEVEQRSVGTIYLPLRADPNVEVRRRFLPALAALLAVGVDRTRLEQEALEAETLRRSDLVKTALLRAVSHDLRSPLTGITTAIGALRNETLVFSDDDRRELLDTIAVDAERLSRLVGDLLDLSRLEAGGAEPALEVWALDELVHETIDRLAGGDRVDLGGESPLVNVDAVQIQRVLANLIENALKFSPLTSHVHVHITATRQEAIVRVVDQGPGLPEAELERVFEPFYRGNRPSGAGLGLAIARGFAEANGGRVWAESRPGQGATFALALPIAEVPAELPA